MSTATLGVALHNRPERRVRGTDIRLPNDDACKMLKRSAKAHRMLAWLPIWGAYWKGLAEDCEAAAEGRTVESLRMESDQ